MKTGAGVMGSGRMKRWIAAALVAGHVFTFGSAAASAQATAGEARVTARSLNVRASASSTAEVVYTLAKDNLVALVSTANPDWYQISYKGKDGYVAAEFVAIVKAPAGGSSAAPAESASAQADASAPPVVGLAAKAASDPEIIKFLTDMGYKPGDEVSVYYDGQSLSFILGQTDGTAAAASAPVVGNPAAPVTGDNVFLVAPPPSEETRFVIGDSGQEILQLQTALFSLGYFHENPTGYFGDLTRAAVQMYQVTRQKQVTDYVDLTLYYEIVSVAAGPGVLPTATPVPTPSATPAPANTAAAPANVELASWAEVDAYWKREVVARVTDVRTGISWNVKRWAGSSHIDCEPLTASDTALMLAAYGGKFDYVRHPLWVQVEGRTFAGSLYGVPHSTYTIPDNNYPGQCCIHVLGSRTHDSSRVDADHQAAVYEAYEAAHR